MALTLNEQILGDLIREIQSASDKPLDDATCLELIARSFGVPDPLALLSAASEAPAPETGPTEILPPVLAFWKSGLLNSFITDYSCRRQPVVAILSGRDSIIILSTSPSKVFEIIQDNVHIRLNDLGVGPAQIAPPKLIGTFSTPAQAFDSLCQTHEWDWAHSTANDVR